MGISVMMSGSHTEEREERAPERARAARAVTTTAATTATITSTDHPTETLKVKKRLSKKAVIWQDTPLTQPLHTAKVTATTEAREAREERDTTTHPLLFTPILSTLLLSAILLLTATVTTAALTHASEEEERDPREVP